MGAGGAKKRPPSWLNGKGSHKVTKPRWGFFCSLSPLTGRSFFWFIYTKAGAVAAAAVPPPLVIGLAIFWTFPARNKLIYSVPGTKVPNQDWQLCRSDCCWWDAARTRRDSLPRRKKWLILRYRAKLLLTRFCQSSVSVNAVNTIHGLGMLLSWDQLARYRYKLIYFRFFLERYHYGTVYVNGVLMKFCDFWWVLYRIVTSYSYKCYN